MIAPAKACLHKYKTTEQCGIWNAAVLDDLNTNPDFNRLSNQLHDRAVGSKFDDPPVMDGNAQILGIEIECGKRLTTTFELSFLSPQYFVTPAFFTLEFDDIDSKNAGSAKYGCGRLNKHGELSTAASGKCIFPNAESDWAVHVSCRFGDTGLGGWVKNQTNRR